MNKFYLSLLIALFSLSIQAQTREKIDKSRLKEFRNNPVWIQMMNDPNTDYNVAVIAFEEFWKDKPEPEEVMRGEEEGEENGEERHEKEMRRLSKKEKEEIMSYAMEYKSFKYWQRKYAAYVKEDGRVMTQEEIQQLIDQELLNRTK